MRGQERRRRGRDRREHRICAGHDEPGRAIRRREDEPPRGLNGQADVRDETRPQVSAARRRSALLPVRRVLHVRDSLHGRQAGRGQRRRRGRGSESKQARHDGTQGVELPIRRRLRDRAECIQDHADVPARLDGNLAVELTLCKHDRRLDARFELRTTLGLEGRKSTLQDRERMQAKLRTDVSTAPRTR